MAIVYKKNWAVFSEVAGAEDAEELLEWLGKHPKGKIDLAACSHLHPANLQVLMAAGRSNYLSPSDPGLAAWVASALQPAVSPL
jgi:hypothetical protein